MNPAPRNLEHCAQHPDAAVLHIFDADYYVINGERAPTPVAKRTVRWECAACGATLRLMGTMQ